MLLSEFLNYFDFDYEIVNGQVRLIDLQGAYLGDIDEDRFAISDLGKCALVDRLDTYINDYIINDLKCRLEMKVDGVSDIDLAEMAQRAIEEDIYFDKEMVDAIVNPDSIEFEKEKIIKSFSVGQIFYEQDTEKYIVLENNDGEPADAIWSFKVYDKNMEYLYDSSIMDARLAKDLVGGYLESVTHRKVLRIEPDCLLQGTEVLSATLENNEKLAEQFADYQNTDRGNMRYVTVDYNPNDDSMVFKLHYEKYSESSLFWVRDVVEVPAEQEEKELLLKEMRWLVPEFFEKIEKPALNETISAAEEQKKFCTPGFNFKVDKEVRNDDR